jgi:hypothetical protein
VTFRRRAGLTVLLSSLTLGTLFALSTRAPALAGESAIETRPTRIDVWRPAEPNTLTAAERAAGWRLLFDGRSGEGWRGAASDDFP